MALTDKLVAIANAIRGKTGKEDPLTLVQMVTEIEGIEVGGGLTEEEAQAMVEEAIGKLKLQSKTVTPTDAEQTITADEGYFGLASVIVEAAEGGGGKPIFESILTDKIENNIVSDKIVKLLKEKNNIQ